MRTLKYSITKILIYTISAMLIYFLKTNVFAMTCDSDLSYYWNSQAPSQSWTFTNTSGTGWQFHDLFKYTGNDYLSLNIPNEYDYVILSFPVNYGINSQSNAESTDIDITMSPINFYIIESNSGFDAVMYGTVEGGFAKFKFSRKKYGNSVKIRGLGVSYPNFYYNFGRSSLWVSVYQYPLAQYYKCDSNSNIENKLDTTNNKLQETQDYLKDDDTSGANGSASGFFNNFNNTDHGGLSGIVSAPMRLVNALSSSSCSPLTFPLPFVNKQVTLPCMSPIYSQNFGDFLTLYRLITTGLIGYWICIKLYGKVRAIKKPEDDRIEVLEL